MAKDLVSQSVNLLPCQLIEKDEEDLKVEIVCYDVDSENVCLLEPSTICTTNLYTESPSICHSKANLVQGLLKWTLKYDIQPAAFGDLLKILSSYYPELELEKEFEDFNLLNKDIQVDSGKESSTIKSGSSTSSASCISEVYLDQSSEDEDCSDQQSQSHRSSKRRKISCSKFI